MVGEKYIQAIIDGAGALPLLVPALGSSLSLDAVLEQIDGLFLTGNPSNVEPRHYAGEPSAPDTLHDPARDATTLPLIRLALARDMPVFAVCRGFQEMNVALGGSLHQRVQDVPGYHDHRENPDDPLDIQYGPSHEVTLVEGGLLHRLAGSGRATVNSLHGQGVARIAQDVTVEALADDGLIEAFRLDDAPGFALAVQWHPEWKVTENALSLAMFRAFGSACRDYAATRR